MSLDTYNVGARVGKERQDGGYNTNKKWIITVSYGECKVCPTQIGGESGQERKTKYNLVIS